MGQPCGKRSKTVCTSRPCDSRGQMQRLCIARAIAVNPEIILMDEPCSALDPIATSRIEDLIHELKRDYTVIIVTHNMQQAARVSDYTAFMYLGKLIEFDETNKIFTAPEKKQTRITLRGVLANTMELVCRRAVKPRRDAEYESTFHSRN